MIFTFFKKNITDFGNLYFFNDCRSKRNETGTD